MSDLSVFSGVEQAHKHKEIARRSPLFRATPSKFFMWGSFSGKSRRRGPHTHTHTHPARAQKELGLSNLYAWDPCKSLCGRDSLCAFLLRPIAKGYDHDPRERNSVEIFRDTGEKRGPATFWRKMLQTFILEFPGKVAARNFAKNPPHFPRGTKQTSFTARFMGAGGPKKDGNMAPQKWDAAGSAGAGILQVYLDLNGRECDFL